MATWSWRDCADKQPQACGGGSAGSPVATGFAELTDDQVDRLLATVIPGGSAARDWFLPHDSERGLANVRDVVRRMAGEWARLIAAPAAIERRVLMTVEGGEASFVCDEGVQVFMFDRDTYALAECEGNDALMATLAAPPHFTDLARRAEVPVQGEALAESQGQGRPRPGV